MLRAEQHEQDGPETQRPDAVPVCERCRRRKQRCDSELRPCAPCVESGVECMIPDPEGQRQIPRSYIVQLEDHRAQLLRQIQSRTQAAALEDVERRREVAAPGSVNSSGRYLGASSGLAFVESAIVMAQEQGILEASDDFALARQKAAYPATDSIEGFLPTPSLPTVPSRGKLEGLFEHFSRVQWQYQIVNRSEFVAHLNQFYGPGSNGFPASRVVVLMILAIALHFTGQNDGNIVISNLADGFHNQAQVHLVEILAQNTLESLQALSLLLLYSVVNPQKPHVWHLLGRTWRIALALGLHTEEGCLRAEMAPGGGISTLPRRLFWSLYSMDRAIGNTLGRPSSLSDDMITASYPVSPSDLRQDDGAPDNLTAAIHCFRLRRLQSEVADILYQRLRGIPPNFIRDVQMRLDKWRSEIPSQIQGSYIGNWFEHAYHNLCMFMHRPSPANPQPSTEDLECCFKAASEVLQLYSRLHAQGSVDSTWIALHWLFLAAVTHLFCLWTTPQIRESADWSRVNADIQDTCMVLAAMTERWHSSSKVLGIYRRLSRGTLKKYASIGLKSPGYDTVPTGTHGQLNPTEFGRFGDIIGDMDVEFWLSADIPTYNP